MLVNIEPPRVSKSPSPRPSPKGRGRIFRSLWTNATASNFTAGKSADAVLNAYRAEGANECYPVPCDGNESDPGLNR